MRIARTGVLSLEAHQNFGVGDGRAALSSAESCAHMLSNNLAAVHETLGVDADVRCPRGPEGIVHFDCGLD